MHVMFVSSVVFEASRMLHLIALLKEIRQLLSVFNKFVMNFNQLLHFIDCRIHHAHQHSVTPQTKSLLHFQQQQHQHNVDYLAD